MCVPTISVRIRTQRMARKANVGDQSLDTVSKLGVIPVSPITIEDLMGVELSLLMQAVSMQCDEKLAQVSNVVRGIEALHKATAGLRQTEQAVRNSLRSPRR